MYIVFAAAKAATGVGRAAVRIPGSSRGDPPLLVPKLRRGSVFGGRGVVPQMRKGEI